jgi:hypothetical protein
VERGEESDEEVNAKAKAVEGMRSNREYKVDDLSNNAFNTLA